MLCCDIGFMVLGFAALSSVITITCCPANAAPTRGIGEAGWQDAQTTVRGKINIQHDASKMIGRYLIFDLC